VRFPGANHGSPLDTRSTISPFRVAAWQRCPCFTLPQRIDLGLLLLPISAAYVVAVVRSAIEEQHTQAIGRKVNLNYCIIVSLFTAIALLGLLITVIQLRGDLDIARRQILLFEIAFGTAFGLIAADLFGKIERIPVERTREQ